MSYCSNYEGYANGVTGGGGSPTTTYDVSNLNDSGAGSFRDACENATAGSRRIEFSVSGDIVVGAASGDIRITADDVTIAAETAPNKGVQIIAHANLTNAPISIRGDNIEVRYLKVRPAVSDPSVRDNIDAVALNNSADGVMFHHCEFMMGSDENANPWDSSTNITFQWCIFALALNEAVPDHAFGLLIGSSSTNVSLHHCLFAHLAGRAPRLASAGPLDIRNCIIYNLINHPMGSGSASAQWNLISNILIDGVDSTRDYMIHSSVPDGGDIYINDNVQPGPDTIRPDSQPKFNILGSPIVGPPAVHTIPSEYVVGYILPYVGAILPVRDDLTTEVVNDVLAGTGEVIDNVSEVGLPTLTTVPKQYKITTLQTVTGSSPTLTKARVEFYSTSSLVHTEDFIIGRDTERAWNGGPTVDINKYQAIRDSIMKFAIRNDSTKLIAPATTSFSTVPAGASDPDGWLADTQLSDSINVLQGLF